MRSAECGVLAIAAALLMIGCSGGGGGSSGGASIAAATSGTTATVPMNVTLRTSTPAVQVGQTVDVVMSADQVQALYGAGADLTYDPDVLELRSVKDGGFIQNATVGGGLRGGAPGVVTIAGSAEGTSAGATGSGDVLVVTFVAKKAGVATISPNEVVLEDAAGNQGVAPGLGPVSVTVN